MQWIKVSVTVTRGLVFFPFWILFKFYKNNAQRKRWSVDTPRDAVIVPASQQALQGGSGQQLLQRRVLQIVHGHDVVQMLQVALLVAHEVRDPGSGERGQVTQPLHVFVGHLRVRPHLGFQHWATCSY